MLVQNTLTKQQQRPMTPLEKIHSNLNTLLDEKAAALPKDFNQTRFLQNCMTVLNDTKGIENMQPLSVARTMLKGAFLGLDFFRRECYAIPYGNELQFQTDYKGDKKIAKKYSITPIKDIYPKLVREGDFFEEKVIDGVQTINFTPIPFNNAPIKGAFAVVLYMDGSLAYESMGKEEIEGIRENFSKAKNSKAWVNTTGEMYKKTVQRRLCKNIEIDFDNQEQQKAYIEGSDIDFDKTDEKIIDIKPRAAKSTPIPETNDDPFLADSSQLSDPESEFASEIELEALEKKIGKEAFLKLLKENNNQVSLNTYYDLMAS